MLNIRITEIILAGIVGGLISFWIIELTNKIIEICPYLYKFTIFIQIIVFLLIFLIIILLTKKR